MSKKVRLAVIGCGGFVQGYHTNSMKECKELEIVGLCDIVPEHAEKLRDEHLKQIKCDPPIFKDYRKMLEAVRPQAVHVSTPHTMHFQHAFDAMGSGAHVLVDKPMVTNSQQARDLVKQSKAKKRLLSIAIQGTHTDCFAYARQLLSDGTTGPIQLVTGIMGQNWMKGTRGVWRQEPKKSGGGQLYDSTCHVLSAMLYLVNSPPVEVFCMADYLGCKVDINAVVTIKFANGTMATMTSGGNSAGWRSHLHFQCENAMMEVSPHGHIPDFKVYARGKDDITTVPKGFKTPTVRPMENLVQTILGKSKLRCTGEVGIMLADLMDGIYGSIRTGLPIKMVRRPNLLTTKPKFLIAGKKAYNPPAIGV